MRMIDARAAAREAVSHSADRPAMAVLFDAPDTRLVAFRLLPGQAVPPHRSPSTVTLTVLEGHGFLTGADGASACGTGDIVVYEPNELHGMRASSTELHILAAITPRPGERAAAESISPRIAS